MTIGGKILGAALMTVGLSTVVGIVVQRSVIRNQGIELTRNTMRGALVEAETVRQAMSRLRREGMFDPKAMAESLKSRTAIQETAAYHTIPVVAGWEAVQEIARQEGYEFRIPKFEARNPKNLPTPDEEKILKYFADATNQEYFEVDKQQNKLVYARPVKLTADRLLCHGDPATSPTGNGKDITGFTMENWKSGEVHGAFVLKADLSKVDDVVMGGVKTAVIWMAPLAAVVGLAFFFIIRLLIVRPLKMAILGLRDGADQVNSAASQVSSAAQQAAANASKQAGSVQEASSSLEQMAQMTRANATDAASADDLASKASGAADQGRTTVGEMTNVMDALNESSKEVSKIIKVIEDIAFQTNLLALNAAVEAARAGEHGKGFAVVAEEVRALAQRSAQAAKNTTELIGHSVQRARDGSNVSGGVRTSLETIAGDVKSVADLLKSISSASSKQASGVEQIREAVKQMDNLTQENAAGAEETAAAAEELTAMSMSLKDQLLADLVGMVEGNMRSERRRMFVENVTVRDAESRKFDAVTHDISAHGVGLRFHEEVRPGQSLSVEVPGGKTLEGKVVRCNPSPEGRFGVGVQLAVPVDPTSFRTQLEAQPAAT